MRALTKVQECEQGIRQFSGRLLGHVMAKVDAVPAEVRGPWPPDGKNAAVRLKA